MVVKAAGDVFFYPDFVSLMAIKMNVVLSLSRDKSGKSPLITSFTIFFSANLLHFAGDGVVA